MDNRWHQTVTTRDMGGGHNKYSSISDKGMLTCHPDRERTGFKFLQGPGKCQSLLMPVVYLPVERRYEKPERKTDKIFRHDEIRMKRSNKNEYHRNSQPATSEYWFEQYSV
jgi:hypothetical protein